MKQFSANNATFSGKVSIKDTIDNLKLGGYDKSIDTTGAVDVFIYDTSQDTDGGAWRTKTHHTSWYKEIPSASRGDRQEFPAMVVIVVKPTIITIYSLDDQEPEMWMVFGMETGGPWADIDCVSMLNGRMVFGGKGDGTHDRYVVVDFVADTVNAELPNYPGGRGFTASIEDRDLNSWYDRPARISTPSSAIVSVAMQVLPKSSRDPDTGMLIPTIIAGTTTGVSVIKSDQTVKNFTASNWITYGARPGYIGGNRRYWWIGSHYNSNSASVFYDKIKHVFTTQYNNPLINLTDEKINRNMFDLGTDEQYNFIQTNKSHFAAFSPMTGGVGDFFVKADGFLYLQPGANHNSSMLCNISSDHNTGWMPNHTRVAALNETIPSHVDAEYLGFGDESDIINNGNFSAGYNGWVPWSADLDAGNNYLLVTETAPSQGADLAGGAYQIVSVEPGVRYNLTVTCRVVDATSVGVNIFDGDNFTTKIAEASHTKDVDDILEVSFVPTQNTVRVYLKSTGEAGVTSIYDGVVMKADRNLVTNGDFFDGDTGWQKTGTGTVTLNGDGTATIVDADPWDTRFEYTIDTQPGGTYMVSYMSYDRWDAICYVRGDGNTVGIADTVRQWNYGINSSFTGRGVRTNGRRLFTKFTATSETTVLRFTDGSGVERGPITIGDVVVRPAIDERSLFQQGLQIHGQLSRVPVAPGAELTCVTGFDGHYESPANRLIQPYSHDLMFGTKDFSVMFWVNHVPVGTDLISVGRRYRDLSYGFYFDASAGMRMTVSSDGTSHEIAVEAQVGAPISEWTHVCATRRDGVYSMYINGELKATNSLAGSLSTDNLYDGGDSDLIIGAGSTNGMIGEDTRFSLLRIARGVPTATMVKKIYKHEQQLFKPGAKCSIPGYSDKQVLDMSHDDQTGVLHVLTGDYKCKFNNLARVSYDINTTDGDTKVSAHDDVVVYM